MQVQEVLFQKHKSLHGGKGKQNLVCNYEPQDDINAEMFL